MKLALTLLAIASLLSVAGCGGGEGCDTAIFPVGNAAYVGSYTAAFTATGGANPVLAFAFTVDAVGGVTGTATDEGIAGTKALSGRAGDRHNGCSKDGTTLELAIADPTIVGRLLSAFRTSRGSLTGTYPASLFTSETTFQGSVMVTKAIP